MTLLEQAESALARGDRAFTLQALASVPPLLVLLGDEESGLLLGAWAESRGIALPREVNPTTERSDLVLTEPSERTAARRTGKPYCFELPSTTRRTS